MTETIKSRQKKLLHDLNQIILDRKIQFDEKLDKIVKSIIGFKSESLKIKLAEKKDSSDTAKIDPKEDPLFKEDLSAFRQGAAELIGKDAEGHFDLGIAYKEMGLLEESIASFKAAQKDGKEERVCAQMISEAYEDLGDIGQALSFAQVSLELSKKVLPRPNKDWLKQKRERIRMLKAKLAKSKK